MGGREVIRDNAALFELFHDRCKVDVIWTTRNQQHINVTASLIAASVPELQCNRVVEHKKWSGGIRKERAQGFNRSSQQACDAQ